MTRETEKRLVKKARDGSAKALQLLINEVANHRGELGATASDVEFYAYRLQHSVRLWDAYDIVSLMQEIVWRLIMNPEQKTPYDPERAPLSHAAWTCLRNAVWNQIKYERRQKRGGGKDLSLDLILKQQEQRKPYEPRRPIYQSPLRRDRDGLHIECAGSIDRVRENLSGPARLVVTLLIAGYSLAQIATIMTTPNNRWYHRRLMLLIQNEIKPSMIPIRDKLEQCR